MEAMRLSIKMHEVNRCIEFEFDRFGRKLIDYHTEQSLLTENLSNAH